MRIHLSLPAIAIAIIIGAIPLLFLAKLPLFWHCWVLLLLVSLLLIVPYAMAQFIALCLLSFCWSCFVAQRQLNFIEQYADNLIVIEGTINHIDLQNATYQPLSIRVKRINGRFLTLNNQFTLRLSWATPTQRLAAGQYWRLRVNIHPVHGQLNEGGFNRQRFALVNRQTLIGQVKKAELLTNHLTLRQQLVDKAQSLIGNSHYRGILIALAFGERHAMHPLQKTTLLQTGTAHLMAISGMHISIAALVGFYLGRLLQSVLATHYINLTFAYLISWLFAFAYSWLAGMNPPSMRAMCALTLWLLCKRIGIFYSAWHIWCYVVAFLILCDPLLILSESAWLSCCAVAALIFWFQWMPLPTKFRSKYGFLLRWVHLQLGISLLILPLQIFIFHGNGRLSLISNLIAVPVISFLVIPLILLALLTLWWPTMTYFSWQLAEKILALLFMLLKPLQSWQPMSHFWLMSACLGWLIVIVLRLHLWRSAPIACGALVLLSFMPWWQQRALWRLDMLDVGHGLAIVVQQGRHAIVYDTGGSWKRGSAAQSAIIPFINYHQLTLEGIIISHSDNDHIGGLAELQQFAPKSWLRTSTKSNSLPCRRGEKWQWQQLTFSVLWPLALVERATNADSCVIMLTDQKTSVLLTGDLERKQELKLVIMEGDNLAANILQTPHHGSKTSSSGPFLRKIKPDITLTSISRFNPWHLPAQVIKQRYQTLGIKWLNTAVTGQITILFYPTHYEVKLFRQELAKRWYNWPFGNMLSNN